MTDGLKVHLTVLVSKKAVRGYFSNLPLNTYGSNQWQNPELYSNQFTYESYAEHDHPGDPEEKNIVPGLHEVEREEPGHVLRLLRPTKY